MISTADEPASAAQKFGENNTGMCGMYGDLFHKHRKAGEIGESLELLAENELARREKMGTSGRSADTWFAII